MCICKYDHQGGRAGTPLWFPFLRASLCRLWDERQRTGRFVSRPVLPLASCYSTHQAELRWKPNRSRLAFLFVFLSAHLQIAMRAEFHQYLYLPISAHGKVARHRRPMSLQVLACPRGSRDSLGHLWLRMMTDALQMTTLILSSLISIMESPSPPRRHGLYYCISPRKPTAAEAVRRSSFPTTEE